MSTSYSVFKQKFRKSIADAIYNEVTSRSAIYYHWFGKENTWTDFLSPFIPSSSTDIPGAPSDNFRYELHVRRDILTAKKVKTADVSYVVPRYDWVYNTVYDMYDDAYETSAPTPANVVGYYGATRLEDARFYVLTSDYNVYKCIDNNNVSPSTIMPSGTSTTVFTTLDGYRWKFLYTMPVSLRNRFLSATYMPVATALKSSFYSNGSINSIIIENGGQGYNPETTTAVITGDGYLEDNPYVISELNIINPGAAYVETPVLTVSSPFPSAVTWSSGLGVPVGSYVKYYNSATTKDNFYYVLSGTKLGTSGPIHTEGTIENGVCQLKYVGTTAKVSAELALGQEYIGTVTISYPGYGYQGTPTPTISVSAPVIKDANWTPSTTMLIDKIIKSGVNYYQVTEAGTSGTVAPTHTTGAAMDNDVEFTFVACDAVIEIEQTKTNAEIDLIITPGIDKVYSTFITNPGTKYTEIPAVTFSGATGATTAEGIIDNLQNNGVGVIRMTNVGSGYVTTPTVTIANAIKTFDSVNDVNGTNDQISYPSHKLVTGDAVTYSNGGGVSLNGLSSGTTTGGSFTPGLKYIIRSLGDTTQNQWNTAAGTSGVTYTVGSIFTAAAIGAGTGTAQRLYYVIRIDNDNIQLATTLANAIDLNAININDGTGTAHTLTLANGIATANAILGTGGEIAGYTIPEGKSGTGYSNVNIQINDSSQNQEWNDLNTGGAVLSANFNVGDVNTLQANVELLAIPGAIEAMKVVNHGSGYGYASLNVLGDGTGATATAVCSGGKIVSVNITNPGRDYTWTDIQITGSPGNDGLASIRAIMSPVGGHGSNAIDELNANSIVFYTSISRDKNQGIEINNDYRKVGLVRNFKKFGENARFTDDSGSGCVLITAQCDIALLQYDMLILKDGYKKYRIVDFAAVEGTDDVQILLSIFNNFTVNEADLLVTDPTNGGTQAPTTVATNIIVSSVTDPTIDVMSGDFLMFSVREPYSPTAEQIITARTVLTV
jgi:hypothetical protein